MPRVTREEREAIDWLREWAKAGFPRRVDQSFPTDFLTSMRRLMDLPDGFSSLSIEEALGYAGPDADTIVPRYAHWTHHDTVEARNYLK